MKRPIPLLLLAALLLPLLPCLAPAGQPSTFVDPQGVWRWSDSQAEVALFGVNYTTPFAHAFRAHRRLGVDWRQAIEADVYHFARLGFDAYRVHVWDREISDAEGNLLVNEHVEALDYLLAQLKQRGIKTVLTPLQFGNAGYPEPGVPLPGFSSNYGKRGSLEDRASWPLQERYLAQFMSHVNPHTGLAYKDDPDVIAVEINNEPGHFEYEPTLAYINTMVRAVRSTGFANPIFYNMSHGLPAVEAYLDAEVQGGTFQWYPTNLLAQHEQRGNFLPYVERYPIPFAIHPKFQRKAKLVYEFDAADTNRSYIYPAIARTFRTTGFQFATQFAYDPLALAPFNTEYQTHYLNLAYGPSKAIGLKIAAEAFRRVPRNKSFGAYPDNTSFADVRISYTDDLAELATHDTFFYSNTTQTRPPVPAELERVAGYGNSPVARYPGLGAYFLDRIAPGVWRLEVMPDAIQVRDPFEKPSPTKHVVRIAWNEWPLQLDLPDLGRDFTIAGWNEGNTLSARARDGAISVRPGVYRLTRAAVTSQLTGKDRWQNIALGEFVAPAASLDRIEVIHTPAVEADAGAPLTLRAIIASPEQPAKVELVVFPPADPALAFTRVRENPRSMPGGGNTPGTGPANPTGAQAFLMEPVAGLTHAAVIPAEFLHAGTLRYHIVVTLANGRTTTFPSQLMVAPTDWSFSGQPWETRLVPPAAPLVLFDATADHAQLTADHRDVVYARVPSDRPGTTAIEVTTRETDQREYDHSFRFFFRDRLAPREERLTRAERLVLYGKSATDQPCKVQLALVTEAGTAFGALVELPPQHGRVTVPLASLRPVRSPNIPHGYPGFIAFWSEPSSAAFDIRTAESVQLSIGPGGAPSDPERVEGVHVERIWLE